MNPPQSINAQEILIIIIIIIMNIIALKLDIELLLLYGAHLDIGYTKDINSKSQPKAIHCAVILGDINIIRQLLNKNAKLIECKDLNGAYPIHYAAKYNKVFAMQELIAYGSKLGDQPLHIACQHKVKDIIPIVSFLINQDADQHQMIQKGNV